MTSQKCQVKWKALLLCCLYRNDYFERLSMPDTYNVCFHATAQLEKVEKIRYNLKIETKEDASLEKLIKNAPWIYLSPFPTNKIVEELRKENIPSQTSLFPGLSLCNGMLYSVLHYVDINDLSIKSGFIHVPLHKSEENPDGMELETMVNATKIVIKVCLESFPCNIK